jgi:hypothetical protein
MTVTIENPEEYLAKLFELLQQCFNEKGRTHAVLVVGNDMTRIMSLHAVNADANQVGQLITAAAAYCLEDAQEERTIN